MDLGTLDWTGIGALLLAFATIWKAIRETPSEVEKVEADTTDKYVQIANQSADLVKYHIARNEELRNERDGLRIELTKVRCELDELKKSLL